MKTRTPVTYLHVIAPARHELRRCRCRRRRTRWRTASAATARTSSSCSRTTATRVEVVNDNATRATRAAAARGRAAAGAGRPVRPVRDDDQGRDRRGHRRLPVRPLRSHRPVARRRRRLRAHGGADDDGAGRGAAVPGGPALARRAARGSRTSTIAGSLAVGVDGAVETVVEVPECPSGLGWLPDGRLLVVSMHDRKLLRLDPDGLTEVADLSQHAHVALQRHGRRRSGPRLRRQLRLRPRRRRRRDTRP